MIHTQQLDLIFLLWSGIKKRTDNAIWQNNDRLVPATQIDYFDFGCYTSNIYRQQMFELNDMQSVAKKNRISAGKWYDVWNFEVSEAFECGKYVFVYCFGCVSLGKYDNNTASLCNFGIAFISLHLEGKTKAVLWVSYIESPCSTLTHTEISCNASLKILNVDVFKGTFQSWNCFAQYIQQQYMYRAHTIAQLPKTGNNQLCQWCVYQKTTMTVKC